MSSWASAADASAIVAVVTSAAAILAVIPFIVREKFALSSRSQEAAARRLKRRRETEPAPAALLESQLQAWRNTLRSRPPGSETPVVIDITREESTARSHVTFSFAFEDEIEPQKTRLPWRRRTYRLWHATYRGRVVRLQIGSAGLPEVLRQTARGLEQEADIIAAQPVQESPRDE